MAKRYDLLKINSLLNNRSYALNTYLGHLRYILTASLTIPILASNQVKPVRKQNLSILKKARSEKRI